MVYDAADHYVLLFSGSSDDSTWTFADGNWTELFPALSPPSRVGAGLVYDARDGYVLLFGGEGKSAPGSTYLTANYLNDTWTFSHGVWSNITPSVAPSPRYDLSLAYDAQDGYVVLFGGDHQRSFLNDTWSFVGGRWTNITASAGVAPSCRFDSAITDDVAAGYVLLYGGVGKRSTGCASNQLNVTLGDSWAFSGGKWRELSPAASPPALWGASLAYDATDGYAVLFGGILTTDLAMQATWKFSSGTWSMVTPVTSPSTVPPARCWGSLVYDGADSYLLLFGGESEPGQLDAVLLNDTWAYRGGVWMSVFPLVSPPARSDMVMTYDSKDGLVLLFGGQGPSGPLNDTWKFVGGSWLMLTPPRSPPARFGASMAYDANPENASLSYVVLFGGVGATGDLLNDTWTFARGEWTNITSATPNATNTPLARYGAAMAYDGNALVQSLVMFGGRGPDGFLNDTWLFENGSWSLASPDGAPAARTGASLAFDAAKGDSYLLLFGGENGTATFGDTWEFSSREKWESVSTSSSPPPRSDAGLVYDNALGALLLFGGLNGSDVLSDTWTYVHGVWSEVPTPTAPPGRYLFGAAYDVTDSIALVFSGNGSVSTTGAPLDDLWGFTPSNWTNLSALQVHLPPIPANSPNSLGVLEIGGIAAIAVVATVVAVLWVRRRHGGPPAQAPAGASHASRSDGVGTTNSPTPGEGPRS